MNFISQEDESLSDDVGTWITDELEPPTTFQKNQIEAELGTPWRVGLEQGTKPLCPADKTSKGTLIQTIAEGDMENWLGKNNNAQTEKSSRQEDKDQPSACNSKEQVKKTLKKGSKQAGSRPGSSQDRNACSNENTVDNVKQAKGSSKSYRPDTNSEDDASQQTSGYDGAEVNSKESKDQPCICKFQEQVKIPIKKGSRPRSTQYKNVFSRENISKKPKQTVKSTKSNGSVISRNAKDDTIKNVVEYRKVQAQLTDTNYEIHSTSIRQSGEQQPAKHTHKTSSHKPNKQDKNNAGSSPNKDKAVTQNLLQRGSYVIHDPTRDKSPSSHQHRKCTSKVIRKSGKHGTRNSMSGSVDVSASDKLSGKAKPGSRRRSASAKKSSRDRAESQDTSVSGQQCSRSRPRTHHTSASGKQSNRCRPESSVTGASFTESRSRPGSQDSSTSSEQDIQFGSPAETVRLNTPETSENSSTSTESDASIRGNRLKMLEETTQNEKDKHTKPKGPKTSTKKHSACKVKHFRRRGKEVKKRKSSRSKQRYHSIRRHSKRKRQPVDRLTYPSNYIKFYRYPKSHGAKSGSQTKSYTRIEKYSEEKSDNAKEFVTRFGRTSKPVSRLSLNSIANGNRNTKQHTTASLIATDDDHTSLVTGDSLSSSDSYRECTSHTFSGVEQHSHTISICSCQCHDANTSSEEHEEFTGSFQDLSWERLKAYYQDQRYQNLAPNDQLEHKIDDTKNSILNREEPGDKSAHNVCETKQYFKQLTDNLQNEQQSDNESILSCKDDLPTIRIEPATKEQNECTDMPCTSTAQDEASVHDTSWELLKAYYRDKSCENLTSNYKDPPWEPTTPNNQNPEWQYYAQNDQYPSWHNYTSNGPSWQHYILNDQDPNWQHYIPNNQDPNWQHYTPKDQNPSWEQNSPYNQDPNWQHYTSHDQDSNWPASVSEDNTLQVPCQSAKTDKKTAAKKSRGNVIANKDRTPSCVKQITKLEAARHLELWDKETEAMIPCCTCSCFGPQKGIARPQTDTVPRTGIDLGTPTPQSRANPRLFMGLCTGKQQPRTHPRLGRGLGMGRPPSRTSPKSGMGFGPGRPQPFTNPRLGMVGLGTGKLQSRTNPRLGMGLGPDRPQPFTNPRLGTGLGPDRPRPRTNPRLGTGLGPGRQQSQTNPRLGKGLGMGIHPIQTGLGTVTRNCNSPARPSEQKPGIGKSVNLFIQPPSTKQKSSLSTYFSIT